MPSLPPQLQKFISDLDKKLHEPGAITNVLDTIEKKTSIKRLHVFAGFIFTLHFNIVYILNLRIYVDICPLPSIWTLCSARMQHDWLSLSCVINFYISTYFKFYF